MRRFAAVCVLSGVALLAEGTNPKTKSSEYPVSAETPLFNIGAEYLVHSFGGPEAMYIAEDYLVIEVAIYPKPGKEIAMGMNQWTLRMNGRKEVLFAQTPGFVAASLKYPDWNHPRYGELSVGAGDRSVIVGRPRPVERFPGDRRPTQDRIPMPRKEQQETGLEKPSVKPHELVIEAALREGAIVHPVAGYLYFPYRGKVSRIKSLELLYTAPNSEPMVLKLR